MSRTETREMKTSKELDFNQNAGPQESGLKINGLQQVVEMLQHADPAFRQSLLRRLEQRDPRLVQQLRKIIR